MSPRSWWAGLDWRIKVATGCVAAVGTAASSISAVPAAWTTMGLPRLATEAHVEQKFSLAQDGISKVAAGYAEIRLRQTEHRVEGKIDVKTTLRAVLAGKRGDLEIFLRQNPDIDVRWRVELEAQLDDVKNQIQEIDRELAGLRVMRDAAGRN